MYCYNCGKFFPDEDVVRRLDGETAMYLPCCPHCSADDIGESEKCEICGGEFPEGYTSHVFCLSCLWNAIDYDLALAYMKDKSLLATFILCDWFDASIDGDIHTSDVFDAFLVETFRRLVADERLRCAMGKQEETLFLETCRLFCLPYYHRGSFGVEGRQFAEWYARRQKDGDSK